jgi:hypothetical protein
MKTLPNSPNVKSLFLLAFYLLLIGPAANEVMAQSSFSPVETKEDPKIQGQVIDENGKAMPGTAILVKDSTTGTTTDINGFFALDLKNFVNQKVTLVLSFPDYNSKEVVVDMSKLPMDFGQIKMAKGL